jgi:hypothetical protein
LTTDEFQSRGGGGGVTASDAVGVAYNQGNKVNKIIVRFADLVVGCEGRASARGI